MSACNSESWEFSLLFTAAVAIVGWILFGFMLFNYWTRDNGTQEEYEDRINKIQATTSGHDVYIDRLPIRP